MISGKISSGSSLHGTVGSSSGSGDHNRLINRSAEDQHPISAITNLQEELDAKLDSETALPLIEEAVKNKAKGLYYDAKKELATKSYWYLTSEIDETTQMGTKESIISGPYDLGQGGGGGGGVTTVTIKGIEWPTVVVAGGHVEIQVNWTSTKGDAAEPTGNGTIYVKVNNKQVIVKSNQPQGLLTFDISNYIVSGANSIQVSVIDSYGTSGVYVGNINAVTLELKSNFNYKLNYSGTIYYTYIPYGDVEKTVYFEIDDVLYGTQTVKSTGEQQTFEISDLTHGDHKLRVYFKAIIDEQEVTSNELFYDLIYYVKGNTTPIIASEFDDLEQEQYINFNIPYRVFIYGKNRFEVILSINGEAKDPITVNTDEQYWEYKSDDIGNLVMQISCGETTKTFQIYVKESSIDVQPVTQNLVLALNAQGRSNTEDPAKRCIWEDKQHGVSCTLTDFNWSSDGWVKDSDKNTVLRIAGDARVVIPYKAFLNDFKNSGKTIELEIATSTVRNYETVIMSCLDKSKSDFFDYKGSFVESDTRTKSFKIELNNKTFKEKIEGELGKYTFNYADNVWTLNEEVVNLADYGITLIEKKLDPEAPETDPFVLDGDAIIITYTMSARGFYITPQIAVFKSQQCSIQTQYKEDDHVRIAFVIEKNTDNRIIWMYINGIASGALQYPTDDSFRQLEADDILLGSNDATLDIYNIRVYDNNLTSKQIVNNWVADTQDATLKAKRYYHNQNYNDKNEITTETMKSSCPDLPQIIWDIDPLPQYKGDKRKGNAYYTDYSDTSRSFTGIKGDYNVQGTSSAVYPVKNIRLNMKKATQWYDQNGDTITEFKVGESDLGANYFTYKVDFASSEGCNNVELTKLYNDAAKKLNILTPPQIQDDRIRVGINGFPIIAFHRDADGNDTFNTKANFNNDKANENVYGFAEGDESWEITNNSADEGNFKKAVTPETFGNAFEIRFPDEDGYSDLSKLQPMTEWVVSTDPKQATNEALPEPIQYKYTHKVRAEDGTYSDIEVTMPSEDTYYTHDTAEYRQTKFRAELKDWFNVDSTIFYYIFTHLFLLVDSRAKNCFPTYFASRDEGDGGDRWFWLPYDMDTAIGINNEGKLVFDYNLEDIDQQDGANVYNGQDSVMWVNVRETFDGEIGAMYAEMRKSGNLISFDDVENQFSEHQAKWSENLFNEDANKKYVVPLASGDNYLEMLQGSKAEQRRWWLYNRFKYFDSKYLAGDAKSDFIQFRAYAKSNVVITPYADIYACVSYSNSAGAVVSKRAERDKSYIMENPLPESASDQETYIYSASQLKSIGDLSGFLPDTIKVGNAVKLQELKVGDAAESYENSHLTELTLGSNTLLRTLDVRNCTSLSTPIDISGCTNIEEVYFTGTKITGITLPDGGTLKVLHLPATLTKLTLKNLPLLNDLVLASSENLESIWLENIPSSAIEAYQIISELKTGAAVRLIGIDEDYTSESTGYQKALNFFTRLDAMKGLDGYGEVVDRAQVQGTIRLQTISWADLQTLKAFGYSEVEIVAEQVICSVKFYNEETIFNTQNVLLGTDAENPGIPEKEPTQQYRYEFSAWDKSYLNVQSDLEINAIYNEIVRQYTAMFDTQSTIVVVEPQSETKDYGSKLDVPTISGLPEFVEFLGWFKSDNVRWNFDEDLLLEDITLIAKYNDSSKPTVTVSRKNYNTISYHATDNLGIVCWALTNSDVEPTSWHLITPAAVIDGEVQISNAGDQYFWVKDAQGNASNDKIISYAITRTATAGIDTFKIYEIADDIGGFALSGTKIFVSATIDSHYKDLVLKLEDTEISPETEITVNTNLNLSAECTPRSYNVDFNTLGKGEEEPSQSVVYKTQIEEPAAQYYQGEIIDSWYTEPELVNKWNFETDVILGDMVLYAKWIAYAMPSLITILIPSGQSTEVMLAYSQSTAHTNTMEIDWGDGSEKVTTTGDDEWTYIDPETGIRYPGIERPKHTYATTGAYVIKLQGQANRYTLGSGSTKYAIVTPAEYIIDTDFSWDISTFLSYALRGSNVVKTNITPYMHEIPIGLYRECKSLTSIQLPNSITEIDDQAFQASPNVSNEIILPKNLKSIGNYVFDACTKITSVKFNDSFVGDFGSGKYLFRDCTSLTDVKLSSSIKIINESMFEGCTSLTEFTVPETVEYLGEEAFARCTSLEKVKLLNPELNYNLFDQKGNPLKPYRIFYYDTKLATAGPIGGDYNIEYAWTEKIPFGTFSAASTYGQYLTSITFPETLAAIDDYAIFGQGFTTINLPENLQTIGYYAFGFCTQLLTLDIPFTVINIGANAFRKCTGLRWVRIYCKSVIDKVTEAEKAWFYEVSSSDSYGLVLYISSDIIDNPSNVFGDYWNAYYKSGDVTKYLTYKAITSSTEKTLTGFKNKIIKK